MERTADLSVFFFLRWGLDQASSRTRGFFVAKKLNEMGISCDVSHRYRDRHLPGHLLRHSIVYLQKRSGLFDFPLKNLARCLGKTLIFDIDDAPFGFERDAGRMEAVGRMMTQSDAVVVGSHKLRAFARRYSESVHLVPTAVDLNLFSPDRVDSKRRDVKDRDHPVTIGWAGNGQNYGKSLIMLQDVFEDLARSFDLRIKLIGAMRNRKLYRTFSSIPGVETTFLDWVEPERIPEELVPVDIGIYPLRDIPYNRYKCGLKGLEYMAMELPVVASPVSENSHIIAHGENGFLAPDREAWREHLSILIQDASLRTRIGKRARKRVEREYSLSAVAEKLIRVFHRVN